MSFIKDIYELGTDARTAAVAIGMGMPFYFVSLYVYRQWLFARIGGNALLDVDTYYILCLCFCMSVAWYAVTSFASKSLVAVILKDNALADNHIGYTYPFLVTFSVLAATFGIAYFFQLNYKWVFIVPYSVAAAVSVGAVYHSYRVTKRNEFNITVQHADNVQVGVTIGYTGISEPNDNDEQNNVSHQ